MGCWLTAPKPNHVDPEVTEVTQPPTDVVSICSPTSLGTSRSSAHRRGRPRKLTPELASLGNCCSHQLGGLCLLLHPCTRPTPPHMPGAREAAAFCAHALPLLDPCEPFVKFILT